MTAAVTRAPANGGHYRECQITVAHHEDSDNLRALCLAVTLTRNRQLSPPNYR